MLSVFDAIVVGFNDYLSKFGRQVFKWRLVQLNLKFILVVFHFNLSAIILSASS